MSKALAEYEATFKELSALCMCGHAKGTHHRGGGECEMFDCRCLSFAMGQPPPMTIAAMKAWFGSFRRVMEAYWLGQLTMEQERVLEDLVIPEQLIGMKPCQR